MIALLVLHAAVGVAVLTMTDRLKRVGWWIGAAPMAAALVYAAANSRSVLDGTPVTEHYSWVPDLNLAIDLRLDGFGLLMTLIVSGIGVAVMAYASRYFSPSQAATRTAGLMVLFSGSMLGLVLADHLIFLFVCWELTSVTSWQLIGAKDTDSAARSGALHALLVTSIGGLALLAGLILLGQVARDSGVADPFSLSEIISAFAADPPGGIRVGIALALILAGVMTKSAQFPTHAWLPGAMVASTPVSAYLHSATMVKAGIYLAARLAPILAATGQWRLAITAVGLTTMLLGGLRAMRQHDLKLLLAMSTVSQLGFLLVMVGTGRPEATVAGITLLVAHALFKATLFLVVGMVDHQAGTRDIRELVGFDRSWRAVQAVGIISAASMAGLPPLLGFIAKESTFEAFTHHGLWGNVTLAGLVAGSVLTFAYSYRFAAALVTRPGPQAASPPPPSTWFLAPAGLLAALTVIGGVAAGLLDPLLDAAASALDPGIEPVHLALWHGLGIPLYMSVLVVALGLAIALADRWVARIQEALRPRFGGEEAFAASVQGLYAVARRITGIVQNGSLPAYCAVILLTALAIPGTTFIDHGIWPGWPDLAASPAQALLATVLIAAAIAAAATRRRFAAVVLLGGIGYTMGLVFVLQGAPDLALTQFSIETLSIAVFMLVLRRLPYDFRRGPGRRIRAIRLLVSGTVAAGVFSFALISTGAGSDPGTGGDPTGAPCDPTDARVSDCLIELAEPEAGGTNVVNVVLVDFRGLDTLGEISVLVIAALGIVALARARPERDRAGARPASDLGTGLPPAEPEETAP